MASVGTPSVQNCDITSRNASFTTNSPFDFVCALYHISHRRVNRIGCIFGQYSKYLAVTSAKIRTLQPRGRGMRLGYWIIAHLHISHRRATLSPMHCRQGSRGRTLVVVRGHLITTRSSGGIVKRIRPPSVRRLRGAPNSTRPPANGSDTSASLSRAFTTTRRRSVPRVHAIA